MQRLPRALAVLSDPCCRNVRVYVCAVWPVHDFENLTYTGIFSRSITRSLYAHHRHADSCCAWTLQKPTLFSRVSSSATRVGRVLPYHSALLPLLAPFVTSARAHASVMAARTLSVVAWHTHAHRLCCCMLHSGGALSPRDRAAPRRRSRATRWTGTLPPLAWRRHGESQAMP